ncbi:IpaD/SipD/SspD family type III secretion system needle tip protein [Pseudomonas fluorescens]|nr:IpaD/SipD/SspD family type III secretion system needle tip protein [Pseudomonas fluorescens]
MLGDLQKSLGQGKNDSNSSHQIDALLRGLSGLDLVGVIQGENLAGETLARLRGGEPPSGFLRGSPKAEDDFFKQLQDMIGFIRDDYLAVYENVLTKYSDFYKDFNETIMANMGEWIWNGDSEGKTIYVSSAMRLALDDMILKYQQVPEGVLYPISGSASKDEALKWAEAIGVPESCVVSDGKGGYLVMMDLSPLQAMRASFKGGEGHFGHMVLDNAAFQAWQTGFNSLEGDFKNQLQLFTTKYSNANSYHENFNKILSSQLSQFADMLKQIVSGIA